MIDGTNILMFDTLDSTNRYCGRMKLDNVKEFTTIWTLRQTDGIGQRGNHWVSADGMNLTFSVVLHPTFLPAAQQYELTKAMALAVSDWLIDEIGDQVTESKHIHNELVPQAACPSINIKWPNDIYANGRKICGMLIENTIGNRYETAICGIGVNVNQTEFGDSAPNATSLKIITGKEYELDGLLRNILECLKKRYDELKKCCLCVTNSIDGDYLNRLMRLNKSCRYVYKGSVITATITGVSQWGHLLLTTDNGEQLECGIKEIVFVN